VESSTSEVADNVASSSKITQPTSPSKQDKNLDEFMKVMKPKKGPVWANEERIEPAPVPQAAERAEEAQPEGLSDLEWMRQRMSKAVEVEERVFEQDDEQPKHSSSALVCNYVTFT